ncbi:hypothetical protein VNO77_10635 [Canavalia gladiata]|uniref:Uncharacterized protein n=1 Tax=Canavalia gladiata TaxID=3824 RepID=A0AAN9MB54_CANGL
MWSRPKVGIMDMGSSDETFVCVKRVKQEGTDEWDECMPLPGDIIEGICEQSVDDSCLAVKTSSEFSSQLGKISPQVEFIWIKVRRGDSLVKLQVRIATQSLHTSKELYYPSCNRSQTGCKIRGSDIRKV